MNNSMVFHHAAERWGLSGGRWISRWAKIRLRRTLIFARPGDALSRADLASFEPTCQGETR